MKHIKRLTEMIKVPIKVGDTILGGRFKNKKIVVKSIGKNEKGDITINGKPLLKFRIIKESILDKVKEAADDNFSGLIGDGYIIDYKILRDSPFIRIFYPLKGNNYVYENCDIIKWDEVAGDVIRFINSTNLELNFIYFINKESDRIFVSFDDILKSNFEPPNDSISFVILFKNE